MEKKEVFLMIGVVVFFVSILLFAASIGNDKENISFSQSIPDFFGLQEFAKTIEEVPIKENITKDGKQYQIFNDNKTLNLLDGKGNSSLLIISQNKMLFSDDEKRIKWDYTDAGTDIIMGKNLVVKGNYICVGDDFSIIKGMREQREYNKCIYYPAFFVYFNVSTFDQDTGKNITIENFKDIINITQINSSYVEVETPVNYDPEIVSLVSNSILKTSQSITDDFTPVAFFNRSLFMYGFNTAGNTPNEFGLDSFMVNESRVNFNTVSTEIQQIHYYVIEFPENSGVFVNRVNNVDVTVLNSELFVLPVPINASVSIPFVNFHTGGSTWGSDDFAGADVINSTHINFTNTDVTVSLNYQVLTYPNSTVQKGTFTYDSAEADQAINAVQINKTLISATHSSAISLYSPDDAYVMNFTNTTNLHFKRISTGTVTPIWYVMEFTDDTIVHHAEVEFDNIVTQTVIIPEINVSASIALTSTLMFQGGSDCTTNDEPASMFATMEIVNSTAVNMTIRTAAGCIANFHLQVVDFNPPTGEDTTQPTFSDIAVNTTVAGTLANFSILWDDETSLNPLGQYIFSTNNTGTFVNDSAINFTTTPSFANVEKTLNSTVGIAVGYRWYATDNKSNMNITDVQVLITTSADNSAPNFTFIPDDLTIIYLDDFEVNFTATDDTGIDVFFINYTTLFFMNSTGTLNNTETLPVGVFVINVSVNDTLGFTNSTLWNLTINQNTAACDVLFNETSPIDYPEVFTVHSNCNSDFVLTRNGTVITNNSLQELGAGVYNFTVTRDDTGNFSNILDTELFTISKINPDAVVTGTTPITFPTAGDVDIVETNEGDSDVTYNLIRDGVIVSRPDTTTLGAGTFEYTSNTSGGLNYTANTSLSNFTLVINQNAESCGVVFNETSPITFAGVFTVHSNCTTTFTLSINGTSISNNTLQALGAGAYNFTVERTDNANYSNVYDEREFVITQGDPSIALAITPSNNEVYLIETTATGSSCPSQLTCTLFRDSVSVTNPEVATLAVAVYNYTFNTTGNTNFTSDSVSENLTITQATPAATLVNNTLRDLTYPDPFNTTFSESNTGDADVTYSIFRNGTDVTAEDNVAIVLAAGVYNYTLNTTGGINYSSVFILDTFEVIISKNTTSCGVIFNETSPVVFPGVFTAASNCTSAFVLTRNQTVITNNSIQVLAVGAYNFSVSRNDTENYTVLFDEREFVITSGDVTGPVITIHHPTNDTFNNATQDLNVTADEVVDIWKYTLNGAANVTFTPNTTITGVEGLNNITIFANDTLGNVGNATVFFTIDSISPIITIHNPTNSTFNNATQDLNVTANEVIDTFLYSLNGAANITFVPNTTITGVEGGNDIIVWGNDTAGNFNFSQQFFTIDTTDPVITIHEPQNITYNETTLDLNVTANEVIDTFLFSLNGAANVTFTPNTTITGVEGLNNITVFGNDSVGNFGSAQQFFTINLSGPVITIHHPTNDTFTNATQDLNVTANIAVDTFWWTNDSAVTNNTFVPNITLTWPEGGTTLTVYANDSLGNVGLATVVFTIDSIAPIITIHNPLNITFNATTVDLNVTANEPIDIWQYSLNSAANITFVPNITIGGNDGLNELIVWANDTAGNFNLSTVFYTLNLTGADSLRNITQIYNDFTGPVAWFTSVGDLIMNILNLQSINFGNGAIITDNSTCLKLSSPDATTTLNICNV